VGVDFSQKLLGFAKKDYPELSFVCEDISNFITKQPQESFDLIVGTSSFQHIPSYKERIFLMKHFYKALAYGGKLMMTNWSFSLRFLQKHQKALLRSRSRYLCSF
jgi:trans-aconitate methyltransferase